jgi:putative oxidoreductase
MSNKFEVSTLILRVVLGLTFFVHGLVKFQGGIENTVGWFASIGLPGALAYAVAILELVGGIALIIGLGSRVISGLMALLMLGATLKVKLAGGFLGAGQGAGYELDIALMAMAVVIAMNGSKLFALDQVVFKKQQGAASATTENI